MPHRPKTSMWQRLTPLPNRPEIGTSGSNDESAHGSEGQSALQAAYVHALRQSDVQDGRDTAPFISATTPCHYDPTKCTGCRRHRSLSLRVDLLQQGSNTPRVHGRASIDAGWKETRCSDNCPTLCIRILTKTREAKESSKTEFITEIAAR